MPPQAAPEIDPRRVEAVVSDLGGVLIDGGPKDVARMARRVGLTGEVWEQVRRDVFGNEGAWAALERGELGFEAFLAQMRERVAAMGGDVPPDERLAFLGSERPASERLLRYEMLEAIRALRTRVRTALLTNNVREWRPGWQAALDLEGLFDVVVDSSEVGTRKPEPRIYEITRERLGVPHESILFIDDIGQNLKAARALGWQTFLFRDLDSTLAVLQTLRDHQ
jgi:putative hydrolase of the HAD superfamily